MKTPDNTLNTPVKSSALPNPSRRGFTARIATLSIAVLGFSMASGLTDFTAPRAEAAGWLTINRYWKGYHYDNGDWQFYYNDGRVKGAGNWTVKRQHAGANPNWSHFYVTAAPSPMCASQGGGVHGGTFTEVPDVEFHLAAGNESPRITLTRCRCRRRSDGTRSVCFRQTSLRMRRPF